MSDTSYPTFQHYGTNAQRLAFTPSPASGTQPIYIWYETDTNNFYVYTTTWHGPYATGGGGSVTTTGTPGSGNLTRFSGASSITNGDLSGDVTTSGTLATTIAANVVTDAKLRQGGATSVIGRSANSTGNVADIAASADGQSLQRVSGALAWSNLNRQNFLRKTANQSVTASTTLVSDTDLTWSTNANEIWVADFVLFVDANTSGDIKLNLAIPAGASYNFGAVGLATSATGNDGNARSMVANSGFDISYGGSNTGTSNPNTLRLSAIVVNGASGGSVTLKWAQNTSNASATTVQANSYVLYTRVA